MRGSARSWIVIPAAVVVAILPACASISASLDSVSDSVSTAFESVSGSFGSASGSSGGEEADAKASALYRSDLCAYTVASLGEADSDLVRGIGRIAQSHGITHWEANANTIPAIRAAIASGGVDASGVERLRRELEFLGPDWVDAALADAPR